MAKPTELDALRRPLVARIVLLAAHHPTDAANAVNEILRLGGQDKGAFRKLRTREVNDVLVAVDSRDSQTAAILTDANDPRHTILKKLLFDTSMLIDDTTVRRLHDRLAYVRGERPNPRTHRPNVPALL